MALVTGGAGGSGNLTTDLGSISAGDDIVLRTGSAVYTAGLDLSATNIDSFSVRPDYVGTLGTNGSSVQLDITPAGSIGTLEYNSSGTFAYFAAASTIERAIIYNTGSLGVFFTDGAVTELQVAGGNVEFNDQTDVPTLNQSGGFVKAREHASQAIDTLSVLAGTCQCERDIGTATVGGTLNVTDASVTPTTVDVLPGGRLRYIGGNIGTLTARPGSTVDFSGLTTDITITTANRWPGVTYIPPAQGVTVTVTTANEIAGGGTFAT